MNGTSYITSIRDHFFQRKALLCSYIFTSASVIVTHVVSTVASLPRSIRSYRSFLHTPCRSYTFGVGRGPWFYSLRSMIFTPLNVSMFLGRLKLVTERLFEYLRASFYSTRTNNYPRCSLHLIRHLFGFDIVRMNLKDVRLE